MLRGLVAALLVSAACGGDGTHPREVAGEWVRDSTFPGGSLRVLDTLELRRSGIGRGHSVLIGYLASARRSGGIDTLRTDRGSESIGWEVVRNEDGRHLCLWGVKHAVRRCGRLAVIPETELSLGPASYSRTAAPQRP
jgi:hypothetical protein